MRLYHFTCSHSRKGIGLHGVIRPNRLWTGPLSGLVWMSESLESTREELGLTSHLIHCDRMEYVYVVDRPVDALPWLDSPLRTPSAVEDLEVPGTNPALWWVSTRPQRARLLRRNA